MPIRVEVVPRRGLADRKRPAMSGSAPPSSMSLSARARCLAPSGSAPAPSGTCASSMPPLTFLSGPEKGTASRTGSSLPATVQSLGQLRTCQAPNPSVRAPSSPARVPEAFATPHGPQQVSTQRQGRPSHFLPSAVMPWPGGCVRVGVAGELDTASAGPRLFPTFDQTGRLRPNPVI